MSTPDSLHTHRDQARKDEKGSVCPINTACYQRLPFLLATDLVKREVDLARRPLVSLAGQLVTALLYEREVATVAARLVVEDEAQSSKARMRPAVVYSEPHRCRYKANDRRQSIPVAEAWQRCESGAGGCGSLRHRSGFVLCRRNGALGVSPNILLRAAHQTRHPRGIRAQSFPGAQGPQVELAKATGISHPGNDLLDDLVVGATHCGGIQLGGCNQSLHPLPWFHSRTMA